ncbi:stationary phase inducible protein CsiE [Rouxiella sp. Mn2063]|uniref:stationary phase inducible protein CsiE n=1 Tax=Rouxiella sp. Mn2063 TaxID=3395262 RepID=UPI003BEC6646
MSQGIPPVRELSSQQRRCNLLLWLYRTTLCTPFSTQQSEGLDQINGVDITTLDGDLAQVRREIHKQHHLEIDARFHVQGKALDQRLCLLQALRRGLRSSPAFIDDYFKPWLNQQLTQYSTLASSCEKDRLTSLIERCESELEQEFTPRDRLFLQLYIPWCLLQNAQGHYVTFTAQQQQWLHIKPEFRAANILYDQLQPACGNPSRSEDRDFFILLLTLLQQHRHDSSGSELDQRLMHAVKHLIASFQDVSGMTFSSDEGLFRQLFAHLGPMIERCKFAIGIENQLQNEVERMYPRLMRTTREALASFAAQYQITLSEAEVGLIAVIFGAWLMQGNALQEKQILLLTDHNSELEHAVEQQIREATLIPLNIKYQTLAAFHQYGAPSGVAMIVTPYATKTTDADPLVIHTQLPLAKDQRKRIRSLLEAR